MPINEIAQIGQKKRHHAGAGAVKMKGKSSLKPESHETVPRFYTRDDEFGGHCTFEVHQRVLCGIEPYFQPIVTSSQHSLYAFEALLRLPGMETPRDVLFRRWEATGEVVEIDTTMARRVVSAIRKALVAPRAISVNVSALTVAISPDAYLAEIEALSAHVGRVIVEVTETFAIPDLGALVYFARRCKALGVFVALDDCTPLHDFCSPSVVRRVQPHILKIDGSLFQACFNQGTPQALVEIIALAKSVKAVTVAEYIETQAMSDWALALGVDLLQGFLFGQAQPLSRAAGFPRFIDN